MELAEVFAEVNTEIAAEVVVTVEVVVAAEAITGQEDQLG